MPFLKTEPSNRVSFDHFKFMAIQCFFFCTYNVSILLSNGLANTCSDRISMLFKPRLLFRKQEMIIIKNGIQKLFILSLFLDHSVMSFDYLSKDCDLYVIRQILTLYCKELAE